MGKNKTNTRKQKAKNQNISVKEVNYYTTRKRGYVVLGTTNNYKVIISNKSICTCPDHKSRKVRCKHIYFILLKILKVEDYQEDKDTYSNNELEYMLNHIIVEEKANDSNLVINETVPSDEIDSPKSNGGFFSRWFKFF